MRLKVKTVAGLEAVLDVDPELPLVVVRAQAASALELEVDPFFALNGRLLTPDEDERSVGDLGLRDGGLLIAVVPKQRQQAEAVATASAGEATVTTSAVTALQGDGDGAPGNVIPPENPSEGARQSAAPRAADSAAASGAADSELARQLQSDEDELAARKVQEQVDGEMARVEQVRQAQGDLQASEAESTQHLVYIRGELPRCGDGRRAAPWIPLMVDTGAQCSILTSALAERLGLLRDLDRSSAGVAGGVGQARILGKLRGITVKFGELELAVDFAVLDGAQMPTSDIAILGLDMLAVHHMVVDLDAREVRVGGREGYALRMLETFELPEEFRMSAGAVQRCAVQ